MWPFLRASAVSAGSSGIGVQLVSAVPDVSTPASLWLCSLVFRSFIVDSKCSMISVAFASRWAFAWASTPST